MAGIQPEDARRWVAIYQRLLPRASLLPFARSKQDRALLRHHAQRLEERLAFWKRWR
jgi:hypothetical protein